MTEDKQLELYIHIPFCIRKCNYCDFLSFACDDSKKEAYVRALIEQINRESLDVSRDCKVISIYFGGGTPSVLKGEWLVDIIQEIKSDFSLSDDCEITIEVNPGTVDMDKLHKLYNAGFNRISIGMQSADDDELRMLGRIHDFAEFESCYANARMAGFSNINVDVILALPGQDEAGLDRTLDKVVALDPEHISAYSLIIEEGTPFYEKYGDIEGPVIGEELERSLYWNCIHKLEKAGYKQYEISNCAKAGYESRHNSGYWTLTAYLGFGLGASSLITNGIFLKNLYGENEVRICNTPEFDEYLMDPCKKAEVTTLSSDESMEEYMFLGMRMRRGICEEDFERRFGVSVENVYAKIINNLICDGLVARDAGWIKLTDKGVDYGNYVFSKFLLSEHENL